MVDASQVTVNDYGIIVTGLKDRAGTNKKYSAKPF
jgi:hypothetical protein